MVFETIGYLPTARGRWHVRTGGGHVWFVNEDHAVEPYVLLNGVMTPVVDAHVDTTAPLVVPKVKVQAGP
jgi:hypothetical protein